MGQSHGKKELGVASLRKWALLRLSDQKEEIGPSSGWRRGPGRWELGRSWLHVAGQAAASEHAGRVTRVWGLSMLQRAAVFGGPGVRSLSMLGRVWGTRSGRCAQKTWPWLAWGGLPAESDPGPRRCRRRLAVRHLCLQGWGETQEEGFPETVEMLCHASKMSLLAVAP